MLRRQRKLSEQPLSNAKATLGTDRKVRAFLSHFPSREDERTPLTRPFLFDRVLLVLLDRGIATVVSSSNMPYFEMGYQPEVLSADEDQ